MANVENAGVLRSRELVETALRVLVAWNDRRKVASADIAVLTKAFPDWPDLREDELACRVIHCLSAVAFPRATGDTNLRRLA